MQHNCQKQGQRALHISHKNKYSLHITEKVARQRNWKDNHDWQLLCAEWLYIEGHISHTRGAEYLPWQDLNSNNLSGRRCPKVVLELHIHEHPEMHRMLGFQITCCLCQHRSLRWTGLAADWGCSPQTVNEAGICSVSQLTPNHPHPSRSSFDLQNSTFGNKHLM